MKQCNGVAHTRTSLRSAPDPARISAEVRQLLAPELAGFEQERAGVNLLDRMERLAGLVVLWGSRMNLTARPGDPAELAFHMVDSLTPLLLARDNEASLLRACFAPEGKVLDIGSGAGFPGLVLASACEADFVLVEARQKRASFLAIAAGELGLSKVKVQGARAGPKAFQHEFDLVVGRAVGATPGFFAIAASASKPGGLGMLYATPSQRLDLASARAAGLGDYRRIGYQVRRKGVSVERVLAIWRKSPRA